MKKNLNDTVDKIFIGEFYSLLQRYYYAEETEEYFANLLNDMHAIMNKCAKAEKKEFYKKILLDFYEYQGSNSCHK